MHKRISAILQARGLKQAEFAKKIGISAAFASELCSGAKSPSDRTISDICREFRVSETWLRTGEGAMDLKLDDDAELNYIMESIGASDPTIVRILRAYWHLSETDKAAVRKLVDNIVEEYKKNSPE